MPVRYILSSVWVRLSIFSPLFIIQYVGLYVFSLPIYLGMIERIHIYTLSYYHHQIGSMNYYPLFRVRSWNNGVRCMSFYILMIMNTAREHCNAVINPKYRADFEITIYTPYLVLLALRWRHNDHAGVSNHQPPGCLLNRLFRRKSKKTSKLRVTGLCAGNSPGIGEFPAQMASYAENVSIWWRHHVYVVSIMSVGVVTCNAWHQFVDC